MDSTPQPINAADALDAAGWQLCLAGRRGNIRPTTAQSGAHEGGLQ
jgi:hypothetical protein